MNVPPWLRDKRVQVGMAIAAGVGLVVLVRRGGGGMPGQESGSGMTLQPAQFDSSGTDLYNAIQSAQQGWSNDLRALMDQLRGSGQLPTQPSTGTGSDPRSKIPNGYQDRPWARLPSPRLPTIPRRTPPRPAPIPR